MQKDKRSVLTSARKKEKARKISVKEGAVTSAMDGFGLRYITPYALALGATNAHIAFLASLPGLLGNISQLFTLKLLKKYSRKRIVITSVLFQSLMWLPIMIIGILYFFFDLSSTTASIAVIISYSLLILFGALAGPAWSSWMKDILTRKNGYYFSYRNKITTVVVLASTLLAGFILDYFQER